MHASNILRAGLYLYGFKSSEDSVTGFLPIEDRSKITTKYLENKTLVTISILGGTFAILGALFIIASMGQIPAFLSILPAGALQTKAVMITGIILAGSGSVVATVHLSMFGLKKYAKNHEGEFIRTSAWSVHYEQ